MIKSLFLSVLIALGAFQVTILDYFKVFGVKPDLILISVFLFGIMLKPIDAVILSIFAGLLKDIFSSYTFGMNTLLLPVWSLVVIRLSKEISIENNYVSCALIFIIVTINDIIIKLALLYLGNFLPFGVFLRITFFGALYTALVSPLVFRAYKFALKWYQRKRW